MNDNFKIKNQLTYQPAAQTAGYRNFKFRTKLSREGDHQDGILVNSNPEGLQRDVKVSIFVTTLEPLIQSSSWLFYIFKTHYGKGFNFFSPEYCVLTEIAILSEKISK